MKTTFVLSRRESVAVHQHPRDKFRRPGFVEKQHDSGQPFRVVATAKLTPGYTPRVKTRVEFLKGKKRQISRKDHSSYFNCMTFYSKED